MFLALFDAEEKDKTIHPSKHHVLFTNIPKDLNLQTILQYFVTLLLIHSPSMSSESHLNGW